ncbi:hypothetical protein [Spirosoma utsteinense]|uniref:Uncharacterized protein n=1 Tax=Spirosoma utsteinense TaxID=2585773 RepID=A0ABR6W3M0_9BACT|nr:hypothetical protein [Spirosoma utsteinense]MBC3785993.1 hypothetical protein [Spirosoma utsteinense]MBC3790691.1 hypothetical protein [Spirosoma utsteinense]
MKSFQEANQLLHSQESKQLFRENLIEEARRTGTMLYYTDSEGRWVEEWPATGELYEVRRDVNTDTIIRIGTLHRSEPALS